VQRQRGLFTEFDSDQLFVGLVDSVGNSILFLGSTAVTANELNESIHRIVLVNAFVIVVRGIKSTNAVTLVRVTA
jgi:hypothetical protein